MRRQLRETDRGVMGWMSSSVIVAETVEIMMSRVKHCKGPAARRLAMPIVIFGDSFRSAIVC